MFWLSCTLLNCIMLLNAQLNDAALPQCVHSLSCKSFMYCSLSASKCKFVDTLFNFNCVFVHIFFRSLPEEKKKAQVTLEPCLQATPELSPSPESPKIDVNRQPAGNNASTPPSEPRKSRVRERRREGRSKTFDWTEFKMEQTEKPVKERADTVDLSSSFSTTSSYCSPSSSHSSLASSPVSTSSLQTSSLSGAHPPSMTEETEKENIRRRIPPHSTTSATNMPNTVTVTLTSTLNTTSPVQPSMPECQEQGKMEVDHPEAVHTANKDKKDKKTPAVQEEIEQRWHQVETTPLREEKQVPITTAVGNSDNSDRLPAHELAALLDKEVCFFKVIIYIIFKVAEHRLPFIIFYPFFLFSWDKSRRSWTDCRSRTTV